MRIHNWRRTLAIALTSAGILVPNLSQGADLQVNLIANPSFELVDTNDPGPFTSVRIADWTDSDGDDDDNFAYPYSSNYSGNPAPPGAGEWHYTGGFGTAAGTSNIRQSFDVSAGDSGALIATGQAQYDLRGFFSTYRQQLDSSSVQARFLDAGLNELGSATIGGADLLAGVPAIGGQVFWGQDAVTGVLPAGTATVEVDIISDGGSGNYDGYVDMLDFRIGGMAEDAGLVMEVNTITGQTLIRNETGSATDINYYEIGSTSGALSTSGWASFADQNLVGFPAGSGIGDGWEESGGIDSTILAESYLLGSSLLGDGESVGIGRPFQPSSTEDIVFRYGLENGLLVYGVVEYVADQTGLRCDFDGSGTCTIADIDSLVAAIVAGSTDLQFDLNGDGSVSLEDITDASQGWLRLAGQENLGDGRSYLQGDVNLDSVVDVADFNTWNSNKFTSTGAWSLADINADGVTDVGDFNLWNGQKFTASDATAVPEPTSLLSIMVGCAGMLLIRRYRK